MYIWDSIPKICNSKYILYQLRFYQIMRKSYLTERDGCAKSCTLYAHHPTQPPMTCMKQRVPLFKKKSEFKIHFRRILSIKYTLIKKKIKVESWWLTNSNSYKVSVLQMCWMFGWESDIYWNNWSFIWVLILYIPETTIHLWQMSTAKGKGV